MRNSALNEICKVDWGNTSLTKKSYVENGEYLGVSAAGADGRMNSYEHGKEVTVISAIGANCGRVFFPEAQFTAIKNTITLTPRTDIVYPKYLFYSLVNNKFPKRGAGQPFITKGDVEKYQISIPPLSEQKRIIAILEKADALGKKRQEADELSNKIIQSTFSEMFGDTIFNDRKWLVSNLAEVVEAVQPGFAFRPKEGMFDVPQIRPHNISSGGDVILDGLKYVSDKTRFSKYSLQKGDLIFNNTNSPDLVGKSAIFDKDGKYYYSNHISRIRVNQNELTVEYLHTLLNVFWNKRIFKTMSTQWVNQAAVNKDRFSAIKIPVPPLSKQQKFAALVQEVEKIKEKQLESKQELDNLFNSLMQKAFKG